MQSKLARRSSSTASPAPWFALAIACALGACADPSAGTGGRPDVVLASDDDAPDGALDDVFAPDGDEEDVGDMEDVGAQLDKPAPDDVGEDPCAASSCGACTPVGVCGWCGASARCIQGTAEGPRSGSCASGWAWLPSECEADAAVEDVPASNDASPDDAAPMDVSVLDGFDDVTAPMDTPGADAPSSIDASLDASPDVALDASMDASTDALPSTCGASGQPCCDGATACAFGLACIAGVCGCRDEGMSCSDHAPCCRGPELTKGFSTARCELGVCVSEVISPCTGCMPAACRDIGQSCDSVRNQCCFYSGGRRLTCGTVGGATQCCMPAGYSGCRVRGTDCCVGAVCHESGRCCKPLTQACDSVGECCPTTGVTCSGNRCCLQDGAATSAPSQCCSGRIDGSNRCTSCIGNSTAACIGAPGTTGNCCGAMTCGTRTRPNQRCCMPERGGCGPANPSVQCCDGLMCNGLRCVPACSSTPTTACGTNAPCCSTLACETQSGTGTACCIPNRSTLATCRTSNDCCTRSQGSVCDTRIGSPTQNRCCRTTITGRCTSQAECCGGLNCENVTGLGVRCCLPPAARCETVRSDDQCCGDMVCDDTFSSSSYGTCCMAQGNSCRNGGPACCDRMQCGTEFGTATYNKCCRPLGQACTPRVAGVCCGRAVCDERTVVPTYARCCKPTGVSCVLSSECCAGATCAGSACCVPYGLACTSNGQCCGGRTCVSGHCA